ncbi:MAG: complex I NDUFA9 subunit family protein [Desulfurobacterium sp.]|nr:MAG: complex I NDUFA9 subunit family protein [Desulfurobacterium sp.]
METHVRREEKAKILITGASGFIATHLISELPEEELLLISRNEKLKEKYPSATFIPFSEENLQRAVKLYRPEVVVNFLGILKESKEETFEKVHFNYTKLLVDASLKSGVRKFVQISALGVTDKTRSRYYRTKFQAEEYIKQAGIPYVIFRPSIVMGRGQKLFEDLKLISKLTPLIIVPKYRVQPVNVKDVVGAIRKAIFEDITGIYELCGKRVVSLKELFQFVLSCIGKRRIVIEAPKQILLPLALLGVGMTLDQYYMMEMDNVCLVDGFKKLGITPLPGLVCN